MSLNTISLKKLPKICFMMCIKGELFKNFHKLSLAVSSANVKLIYRKGDLLSKGGGESVDFPTLTPPPILATRLWIIMTFWLHKHSTPFDIQSFLYTIQISTTSRLLVSKTIHFTMRILISTSPQHRNFHLFHNKHLLGPVRNDDLCKSIDALRKRYMISNTKLASD